MNTYINVLTTLCNFDCTYCFETNKEEVKHQTIEDIKNWLDDIAEKENHNDPVTVVFFGGEPMIRFDLIKYIVNYGIEKYPGKFWWYMTTNGSLLLKNIMELIDLRNKSIQNNTDFVINVSFDGFRDTGRRYKNGKMVLYDTMFVLDYLDYLKFNYHISYTVGKLNYQHIVKDLNNIFNRWSTCERISLNWDYSNLKTNIDDLKNNIKNDLVNIYDKYKRPICFELCNICLKCKKEPNSNDVYKFPKDNELIYVKKEEHKETKIFE